MRRNARHATEVLEATAIEVEPEPSQELALGMAPNAPVPLGYAQANPYMPIYGQSSLATAQLAPQFPTLAHPLFRDLGSVIADQVTPGLADRTGWGFFQWLQDRHLLPGIGVFAGVSCGWGAAATEPMHPWFGGVGTGVGLAATAVYGAMHLIGSINSNEHFPVSAHAIGIGGIAVTAFGVACITGLSFLSAGVTIVPLAVGYYAWFQSRHSRISDQRRFVTEITAASMPEYVPMPMPVGAASDAPNMIDGVALSHEESMVRRAFEGMGIKLQDLYNFERIDCDSFAVTVVFAPASNVSPESVIARRDVLTSSLGARQVIALPTQRGHELRLTIRYGETDPLAETIPFPGPTVTSIKDAIPIGESADGSVTGLVLHGVHTLVGGATGGGKSVVTKAAVTSLAAIQNAVVWLIDLKPGRIELGVFEPIADRSARSLADAALMFEALIAVAKARGEYLASLRDETGQPVEEWDPDVHGPDIVVVIDELAELVRQGKKVRKDEYPDHIMEAIKFLLSNFETVAQVYRALGILLKVATQSPSGAVTAGNGKDAIDQFQNLLCFPTAKVSQTNIILGQGAHGDGFKASTDLYMPGMFYMKSPRQSAPVKHKAYRITNEQIVEYINEYADKRPALDALSAEAAAAVLGTIGATPRTDPGGGGGTAVRINDAPAGATRANLRSVPTFPDRRPVREEHRALWLLLNSPQFRREGATNGELQAAAIRAGHDYCSPAWVRDRTKEWRESGYVTFEKEGQEWRIWRDDETLAAKFDEEEAS